MEREGGRQGDWERGGEGKEVGRRESTREVDMQNNYAGACVISLKL